MISKKEIKNKRKIFSYVSLFVLLNSPLATPVVTVLAAEGNDSVQSDTTKKLATIQLRLLLNLLPLKVLLLIQRNQVLRVKHQQHQQHQQ